MIQFPIMFPVSFLYSLFFPVFKNKTFLSKLATPFLTLNLDPRTLKLLNVIPANTRKTGGTLSSGHLQYLLIRLHEPYRNISQILSVIYSLAIDDHVPVICSTRDS